MLVLDANILIRSVVGNRVRFLLGKDADNVDSQYLVGSLSPFGYSINNHSSGYGSARS